MTPRHGHYVEHPERALHLPFSPRSRLRHGATALRELPGGERQPASHGKTALSRPWTPASACGGERFERDISGVACAGRVMDPVLSCTASGFGLRFLESFIFIFQDFAKIYDPLHIQKKYTSVVVGHGVRD